MPNKIQILDKAVELISSLEGFSSKPYWDVKRFSWGYGTIYDSSKESYNTISKEEAKKRMRIHIEDDYNKLVKIAPYMANDWLSVPVLSKLYQYGDGILIQWKSYIHDKVKFIQEVFFIDEVYPIRRKKEIEYYNDLIIDNKESLAVMVVTLLGLVYLFTRKK